MPASAHDVEVPHRHVDHVAARQDRRQRRAPAEQRDVACVQAQCAACEHRAARARARVTPAHPDRARRRDRDEPRRVQQRRARRVCAADRDVAGGVQVVRQRRHLARDGDGAGVVHCQHARQMYPAQLEQR